MKNTLDFGSITQTTNFGTSSYMEKAPYNSNKPVAKPMEKFKPSSGSLQFWEKFFKNFGEVTIIDYLNALIPILENETHRKFTDNQLYQLIEVLNYENNFTVNKYES
jgi:hypothetical protein